MLWWHALCRKGRGRGARNAKAHRQAFNHARRIDRGPVGLLLLLLLLLVDVALMPGLLLLLLLLLACGGSRRLRRTAAACELRMWSSSERRGQSDACGD
jgi:hypothetical protein